MLMNEASECVYVTGSRSILYLFQQPGLDSINKAFCCSGSAHLKFLDAMKAEHCSKAGSNDDFETPNYAIKSTPYREWCLVVDKEKVLPEPDMRYGRRIPDIDELMALDVAKRAKLSRFEVIAVVLYTGPMVTTPPRNLVFRNCTAGTP